MPCNETPRPISIVDKVAATMLDEWARAEGDMPNISYIATFVDMARRVIEDFEVKERG